MAIKCNKCGKGPISAAEAGSYLTRVNPTGVLPGIFECRPSCDQSGTQEEALIGALEDWKIKEQSDEG